MDKRLSTWQVYRMDEWVKGGRERTREKERRWGLGLVLEVNGRRCRAKGTTK